MDGNVQEGTSIRSGQARRTNLKGVQQLRIFIKDLLSDFFDFFKSFIWDLVEGLGNYSLPSLGEHWAIQSPLGKTMGSLGSPWENHRQPGFAAFLIRGSGSP